MNFDNKVVLITGSGSGIGQATAMLFAQQGAHLVIADWNEEAATITGEKCKEFGKRVLVMKTDVTKTEEAKNVIDKTIEVFGQLDVLVNNAAIIREGNLLSGNIMDTYDEVLNINLRSVVLMTSLATPHLIKTKGCIVNTSSVASTVPQTAADYPAYAISKAGVDSFTRLSALELAPKGVRVNAVNPGPVLTNILNNSDLEGNMADYDKVTALGRVSDPSEIADLIVYLSSNKAKSITGSIHCIDNGLSLV